MFITICIVLTCLLRSCLSIASFTQDTQGYGGIKFIELNPKYNLLYRNMIDYEKMHAHSLGRESFMQSYTKRTPASINEITNRYLVYTIHDTGK